MIKIEELRGSLLVGESKYYRIYDNKILVNKEIIESIFLDVDISTNNLHHGVLKYQIRKYFDDKICNLPVLKINGNIEFVVGTDLTLTEKNFKKLFINLNYLYNSVREYINLSVHLYKSVNRKLAYLGYKSVNNYILTYNNLDKEDRVLDYTIILDGTTIKVMHSKDNSTIMLTPILFQQVENVLVKNLKFKKESDSIYSIELLNFRNAKEIFEKVKERLGILEDKMKAYSVLYPSIQLAIDELAVELSVAQRLNLDALFKNLILYQKDLKIEEQVITISDRLGITKDRTINVPRDFVEDIIVLSNEPFKLMSQFRLGKKQITIDENRMAKIKENMKGEKNECCGNKE